MSARDRLGLWRDRSYLLLWSADTISQAGSQVTLLALPLAAVLVLHASAFEVAALAAIEFAPFLLFSLPAGVWIDRVARRPVLVAADVGRAIALVSVPVAAALGSLTVAQLFAVAFLTGTLTVFFDVSYQAFLPTLVDRDQLVEGNAKLELSRSAAQVAGPSVAGGLVQAATAPVAILVDAASFLVSALLLTGTPRDDPPARVPGQDGAAKELRDGLAFVFRNPYLRSVAACTALTNLFGNLVFALYVVYATRHLGLAPAVLGLVFSVGNIGFTIGALVANRAVAGLGVGRAIVGSSLLFGPALVLIPLAPPAHPVPFLVASGVVGGFALVVYNIAQISFRQSITPDRLQGRMNSVMRFLVWGAIPVGSLAGGALAATVGIVPALWVGALGGCLACVPVLASPVRVLVSVKQPEPRLQLGPQAG